MHHRKSLRATLLDLALPPCSRPVAPSARTPPKDVFENQFPDRSPVAAIFPSSREIPAHSAAAAREYFAREAIAKVLYRRNYLLSENCDLKRASVLCASKCRRSV